MTDRKASRYIASSTPKTKERWLKEALESFSTQRYEDTLKACEQAIRLDCNYARAWVGKGLSLSKLGFYEEALLAFEYAIHLDPDNAKAYNGKGSTLYSLKRYKEAITAYNQALSIDPECQLSFEYTASLCEEGDMLRKHGQYTEALSAYERAIQFDPNFGYSYYGKGLTLHYLRCYEEALTAFEKSFTIPFRIDTTPEQYRSELLVYYKISVDDYDHFIRLNDRRPSVDELLRINHHRKVLGQLEGNSVPAWQRYGTPTPSTPYQTQVYL